jgi:hypothetical protein
MNDPYYIEKICGVETLINQINLNDIQIADNDDF